MTTLTKAAITGVLITAAAFTAYSLGGGLQHWAAAAFLMVAAVIIFTIGEVKIQASQKGITLQTLIVTAVLVLMAGAAGVVIISITNSQADNLEGQNAGIDSRCEPWEIFDPTLDAAGRGGGQGGIDSSASGCVRVCYVRYKSASGVASASHFTNKNNLRDTRGTPTLTLMDGYPPALAGTPLAGNSILLFSRSSIFSGGTTASTDHTLPVNGERTVDANGSAASKTELTILNIDGKTSGLDNYEIKVASNQRYCHVWNNTTDEEVFRSPKRIPA